MADLLLERAGEVAAIERAVRLARAGRARQLVVIGPAGSGRTSVLAHARRCAADHELTILHAEGLEHERDFPFALAGRLLGLEVQPEPGYDTLLELNRRLAARAPALIAVDDLDRCDAQSRDWLVFAARRLDRVGVAMVLVGDPGGLERAVELSLRPFSERAVATALHLQLGHTVDPAFARACHAATLGHPLLVCELAAAARDGQERADVVPSGVVRFLQRVLSPLPRNVRTLAHAVALLDQGASVHGAATLAGLGPTKPRPRPTGSAPRGCWSATTRRPSSPRSWPARCTRASHRPSVGSGMPAPRGSPPVRPAPFTTCCAADRRAIRGSWRPSPAPHDARSPTAGRTRPPSCCAARCAREPVTGGRCWSRSPRRSAGSSTVPRSSSSKRPSPRERRIAPRRARSPARSWCMAGRRTRWRSTVPIQSSCTPVHGCSQAMAGPWRRGWPSCAGARRSSSVRCWPVARRRRPVPPTVSRRPSRSRRALSPMMRSIPSRPPISRPAPRSRGRTGSRRPVSTSSARSRMPDGSDRSAAWCAPRRASRPWRSARARWTPPSCTPPRHRVRARHRPGLPGTRRARARAPGAGPARRRRVPL